MSNKLLRAILRRFNFSPDRIYNENDLNELTFSPQDKHVDYIAHKKECTCMLIEITKSSISKAIEQLRDAASKLKQLDYKVRYAVLVIEKLRREKRRYSIKHGKLYEKRGRELFLVKIEGEKGKIPVQALMLNELIRR